MERAMGIPQGTPAAFGVSSLGRRPEEPPHRSGLSPKSGERSHRVSIRRGGCPAGELGRRGSAARMTVHKGRCSGTPGPWGSCCVLLWGIGRVLQDGIDGAPGDAPMGEGEGTLFSHFHNVMGAA